MLTEAPSPANRETVEGIPHSLDELLRRFPWAPAQLASGQPVEWLWRFRVQGSMDALWPLLADTSRLNRSMGLPPMQYQEIDGRLHGRTDYWGFIHEWVEPAWEWEYASHFACVREYSRGLSHWFRGICTVAPAGDGALDVGVYFGWIPRGWWQRFFLARNFPKLEPVYGRAFKRIEEHLRAGEAAPFRKFRPALAADADDRLRNARAELAGHGIADALIDRLLCFIREEDDQAVSRIRVRALARKWGVDERSVLQAALQGTRLGLLVLNWDVICPHCRGVRFATPEISRLPRQGRCDVCDIDFATSGENAIEVSFAVHPGIRSLEKILYCAAETSTREHVRVQRSVAPGATGVAHIRLPEGRYRLRKEGSDEHAFMSVGASRPATAAAWPPAGAELEMGRGAQLVLTNPAPAPVQFVIEDVDWRDDALKPAGLFSLQQFHDLFADEFLDVDTQLDVGRQTIMFTDVVSSSRYYLDTGDAKAFALMKEHFDTAQRVVGAHGGAVIKTIGDATMAAFGSPLDAVRAAEALQRSPGGVQVRISIHAGTCIAVHLNSGIDYFGKTVIIASRMQKHAQAHDILISGAVATPQVSAWLAEKGVVPHAFAIDLPELAERVAISRWHVS